MYDAWRFRTIVLLMILFGVLGSSALLHHHFPVSFGAMLCLLPCLLRETAAGRGVVPRRTLGSFEVSCLVGGALWVFVSPLLD